MGKKIKSKNRHILVDALCFLMHAVVHAADIQDRDGRILVPTGTHHVPLGARADEEPTGARCGVHAFM